MFFVLAALMNAFLAAVAPSPAWAYLALVGYLVFVLLVAKTSPATFILFSPLIALRATEMLSGAAIESGAYMTETTEFGSPTGSFSHLLIIYILFFSTAAIVIELSWPRLRVEILRSSLRWQQHGSFVWHGLVAVFTVATTYLAYIGIRNGFPLFTHVDRFAYLKQLDSSGYYAWVYNRIVLVPFMGLLFCLPSYRSRSVALLVCLLSLSVLFGEKFTSLLLIVCIFSIPPGLLRIARGSQLELKTVGLLAGAIITITIPAVLIVYGALNNLDAALNQYGSRVALQGQLWFRASEEKEAVIAFQKQPLIADARSWLNVTDQNPTTAGTDFGLYYVMERYTPATRLEWAIEGGNGFVFSLYPYLLLTTGLVGLLVVSSLLAAYQAWSLILLSRALAQANWLAVLCFGRVMSSFFACYTTGYFWNVFGLKTFATVAFGLVALSLNFRTTTTKRISAELKSIRSSRPI
jgi:hypothetical protein